MVLLLLVGGGALAFVGLGSGSRESVSENATPTTNYVPATDSTGKNSRISYAAGNEETVDIFSSNLQGGNEEQITDDGVIYDFSYSPNGDKIAFIRNGDLYIAEADGSGETQLAQELDYIESPAFSPDGEFVAFASGSGTDKEIYTVRADGSELNQLTDGPGQLESKNAPAWNPQDMEIAFQATYDAGSNDDDTIFTVDFPDGDNLVQITESGDPDNEYAPAYSPDGETIAYASSEDTYYAGASDIYTIAADGSERGNATRLTEGDRNLEPVFSPDGERIAYASTSSPLGWVSYDIFTMDSETGDEKENVTETSDRGESSPSWSDQGSSGDNSGYSDMVGDTGSSDDESNAETTDSSPATNSSDDSADSDTGADDSPGDSGEGSLDQAVGDYYRAVGLERWSYTYSRLGSQTKSMFTEEEWSRRNQWFWDRNPTVYHILSIESDGEYEGSVAEVDVGITGEDGSYWVRSTYFVKEGGEWMRRFSEEETELFMPEASYEEFVEAHTDASS